MMNEELKKQLRNRRICVVIPTYNNDKTIKTVVEKCLLYCDECHCRYRWVYGPYY